MNIGQIVRVSTHANRPYTKETNQICFVFISVRFMPIQIECLLALFSILLCLVDFSFVQAWLWNRLFFSFFHSFFSMIFNEILLCICLYFVLFNYCVFSFNLFVRWRFSIDLIIRIGIHRCILMIPSHRDSYFHMQLLCIRSSFFCIGRYNERCYTRSGTPNVLSWWVNNIFLKRVYGRQLIQTKECTYK